MNIIIIIADDLGYGDVGYKNADAITPNIDKLALEGTRLENFYVQSSCSPTRASLMTGMYCYRLGMQRVIWPWNTNSIDSDAKFLPQYFKDANYTTKMFGKWNLGHSDVKYIPINRGFDYHYGNYYGNIDHWTNKNGAIHDLLENNEPTYCKGHNADCLTNKIVENLKTETKPFFYYIAYNSPHTPLQYPSKYKEVYKDKLNGKRLDLLSMVTHLDDCIGKILVALDENNLREDTLIWFTSDNGGFLNAGSSNGIYRGGKTNNYEGGIKAINFINYKPWNNGLINNGLYHAVDFVPTLCKLIGVNHDDKIDGSDISIFIENQQSPKEKTIIYDLFFGNYERYIDGKIKIAAYAVIRKDNYKIHLKNNIVELYDIEKDPKEEKNLALENNIEYSSIISDFYKLMNEVGKNSVKDPQTWWKPSGHPKSWVSPKDSSVKQNLILLQVDEKNNKPYVDTEEVNTDEIKHILGYYNL